LTSDSVPGKIRSDFYLFQNFEITYQLACGKMRMRPKHLPKDKLISELVSRIQLLELVELLSN